MALMLPNLPQTVIAYWGALKAGAIVVHTNPLYVPREIETQLVDSRSDTLVALDLFYPRLQAVREHVSLPKRVIVTSVRDFLPPLKRFLYPFRARLTNRWIRIPKDASTFWFLDLLNAETGTGDGESARLPHLHPDDLAQLQYTGGTTGTPKGAMLTHRNVVTNAFQGRYWVSDFQEGREVFLGVIPFFHAYGLSSCQNLAILTGSLLVLLPKFQVEAALRAIEKHRVTIFPAVPMMLSMLATYPEAHRYDFQSLRICMSGGSALHAEIQDRFERLTGVRVAEGYGLTEAGPVTHCNPIYGDHPSGSMGIPFPNTDARIVDLDTGVREMPIGELGELAVRGPQIMRGYWNNEPETKTMLRDGWLYTGDIARQDDRGYFYVVDRKKDIIKTRGENVYPREVEEILLQHPSVSDAVVVGLPHPLYGEAVKAYVVPKAGARATEQDLIAHCNGSLARFKVPASIEFRSELPRSFVGKVLRRTLRDEAVAAGDPHLHRKAG